MWIGFPSDAELWVEDLAPAQEEVASFARALYAEGRGEEIILVAAGPEAAAEARRLAPFAKVIEQAFGDIWLRDTGPIVLGSGGARRAQGFGFNGWGGKYDLEGDDSIGERLAGAAALPYAKADWILEGGAVEGDGSGLFVTTEQCLLNPNRNPSLSRADVEARLARDLGASRVLWLGEGLANDHTDGHVDADDEIVPASYMNFLIGNAAVIVPLYGATNDEAAVAAVQALFPGRLAVGLRADHILTGGGSFHCISQQLPA
jgi:agmatine deiminase